MCLAVKRFQGGGQGLIFMVVRFLRGEDDDEKAAKGRAHFS